MYFMLAFCTVTLMPLEVSTVPDLPPLPNASTRTTTLSSVFEPLIEALESIALGHHQLQDITRHKRMYRPLYLPSLHKLDAEEKGVSRRLQNMLHLTSIFPSKLSMI
jgi:hypothetical protein